MHDNDEKILDGLAIDQKRLDFWRSKTILIKYGGNAMVQEQSRQAFARDIHMLKHLGIHAVIVHGGGPAIAALLETAGLQSEFIGGHRKTDATTMGYVEMALAGKVNKELVKLLRRTGLNAVGICGKDGGMVTATKRYHQVGENGTMRKIDLGFVGNVKNIDPQLIETLLAADYLPVVAPISTGEDGEDYNINADMFAGHLAGALLCECYIVLTDVDGLRRQRQDASSTIAEISVRELEREMGQSICGGMIPKVESCSIALEAGVKSAHIVNGARPHSILRELLTSESGGTKITSR